MENGLEKKKNKKRFLLKPAIMILFFKTKVIGIELQSFAKTLAINSAISQIAL